LSVRCLDASRAPLPQGHHANDLVVEAAPTSCDEFARFIGAEIARWARAIKAAVIAQQ
jgi:hypothetical protein